MPYFLSDKNLVPSQQAIITGEEAGHILLSHRVKKGEKIKLQGPDGKRFLAEVVTATKKDLTVKVLENLALPKEPGIFITLYQSVVSEKALDFIFQKGTELGLGKIVLFNSANTATKVSDSLFNKKLDRWNKILKEAAKQSERAKWPALEFAKDVNAVMAKLRLEDKVLLADISGENPKVIMQGAGSSTAIIIGPEGGFTAEEISGYQTLKNLRTVSLGPILLRADTAALAIVAIMNLCNI